MLCAAYNICETAHLLGCVHDLDISVAQLAEYAPSDVIETIIV